MLPLASCLLPLASVVFQPLFPGVTPPARATAASAGYDLRAWLTDRPIDVWSGNTSSPRSSREVSGERMISLQPGERAVIPLGFRATVPSGFEAQVRARSGTALKLGLVLANGPGTIDPDYIGEWGVLALNASTTPITIRHGDRVAQLVFSRFEVLEFTEGEVVQTTERTGGFGSTGVK
jgi:dUTP pyrophosphatase